MAYITKYNEIEKKILLDNYGCNIKRFLNIQKINLELLSYYILNKEDINKCNNLLNEIIAINMIVSKKLNNVKK